MKEKRKGRIKLRGGISKGKERRKEGKEGNWVMSKRRRKGPLDKEEWGLEWLLCFPSR